MDTSELKFARSGEVTCHNYVRRGYQRLTWGVYGHPIDTSEADDEYQARRLRFIQKVRAVTAAYRDVPIALHGSTGLQVLGVALPKSAEDWDNCHLSVPKGASRPRRVGVIPHSLTTLASWTTVQGMPVPNPVDLWVQLRGLTEDELVEVGDGLVRRKRPLMKMDQLRRRLDELAGIPGIEPVRQAARFVLPRTDSIYESRVRMIIVRAGLPTPAVNLPVPVPMVGYTYHIDMAYKEQRIGVEYDGKDHGKDHQIDVDAARHRDLLDAGWFVIVVTATQLGHPEQFLRPLERALIMRAP